MKKFPMLLLVGCVVVLSACGTIYVNLEYPESGTKAMTGDPEKKIMLVAFEDMRKNLYLVGALTSSNGLVSRDVMTKDSGVDWVTSAYELELKAIGYSVEKAEVLPEEPTGIVVLGKLLDITISTTTIGSLMYAESEISIRVLNSQKDVLFEKTYKERETGGLFSGLGALPRLLSTTLRANIKKSLTDLVAVLPKNRH